jgi:hypothetical protein
MASFLRYWLRWPSLEIILAVPWAWPRWPPIARRRLRPQGECHGATTFTVETAECAGCAMKEFFAVLQKMPLWTQHPLRDTSLFLLDPELFCRESSAGTGTTLALTLANRRP